MMTFIAKSKNWAETCSFLNWVNETVSIQLIFQLDRTNSYWTERWWKNDKKFWFFGRQPVIFAILSFQANVKFFPLKYKINVYLHCTFLTNLSVICPETTLPNIPPISRKLIAMLPTNVKNKKGSISEHEWTVFFLADIWENSTSDPGSFHIMKAVIWQSIKNVNNNFKTDTHCHTVIFQLFLSRKAVSIRQLLSLQTTSTDSQNLRPIKMDSSIMPWSAYSFFCLDCLFWVWEGLFC